MNVPAHVRVYREPLIPWPSMQTYTLHVNELCQIQWDYTLHWSDGKEPKLWIFSYRCFQRAESSAEFEQVDQIPFDIPVWDEVVLGITQQIASVLYGTARIVGPMIEVTREFSVGAEEAANKRYDMRKYREMTTRGSRSIG